MQSEDGIDVIPPVIIQEVTTAEEVPPTTKDMAKFEKVEDEQAYQDFVTAFLDRLCENCKRMREQIIVRAKCAGILMKEGEEDGEDDAVEGYLAALVPDAQMKVLKSIRRRTVNAKWVFKPFWFLLQKPGGS